MSWLFTDYGLYGAYGLSVVLQLLLGYRAWWRIRKLVVGLCIVLFTLASVGLVGRAFSVWTVCLAIVAVYSIYNLLRITRKEAPAVAFADEERLFHSLNMTALWLGAMQTILIFLAALWAAPPVRQCLAVIVGLQLVVAIILLLSARRQITKTDPLRASSGKAATDLQLPSITVAVPARNEDAQLKACLDSILRSDYPKLEVIVLDDCSADRTPEIIRQFAQEGVRFIRGKEPSRNWLPKNQAYDRLLQEASGKLVLFCGVDVRFQPGSIRMLEAAMHAKHKTMMGVLPQNKLAVRTPAIQAMRYYWEMVPPRRLFRRPPVLSSCWLATKAELQRAGSFAAVKGSMSPEAYFAHQAMPNDGYSFVRSNKTLGITSEKDIHEQYETAIYSRYPQLHRRPELIMLLSVAELVLLVGPLACIPWAFIAGLGWPAASLALLAYALNTYSFALVQRHIFVKASILNACLVFPVAILSDIWLLNLSMHKYEFSEVIWKGRQVSFPVMNAIHALPPLPELPEYPESTKRLKRLERLERRKQSRRLRRSGRRQSRTIVD